MNLNTIIDILQCPNCQFPTISKEPEGMSCNGCESFFTVRAGIPLMLSQSSKKAFKQEMIEFWHGGWQKRGGNDKSIESKEKLLLELGAVKFFLALEKTEHVNEMTSISLKDKRVLEIGCGAGGASVLFALQGAEVIASDLTDAAVAITDHKFTLLGLNGCAVQADAEYLPFQNNTFDVVYSSGVLHHTPDIERAVAHIYRVLKPGGHAIIMLYSKWSFKYMVSLLLVRGLLLGGLWRYGRKRWLGNITERGWHTEAKHLNPLTRVYSGKQMTHLFRYFEIQSIRKYGFYWSDIFPGIYRFISRRKVLLGDGLSTVPTELEAWIARHAGFSMVLHAIKPMQ